MVHLYCSKEFQIIYFDFNIIISTQISPKMWRKSKVRFFIQESKLVIVVVMIFGFGKVIIPIVERYGLVAKSTSYSFMMPLMEL
jgi:hypothetical protein